MEDLLRLAIRGPAHLLRSCWTTPRLDETASATLSLHIIKSKSPNPTRAIQPHPHHHNQPATQLGQFWGRLVELQEAWKFVLPGCSVKWLDNRSSATSANREKSPILQGGWMGKYSDLAFVFTAKDLLHTYLIHATDTNTLKYSESPKVHRGTRHLKHQTLCRVYKPHWCSYDHPSYRESPEVYIR